MNGLALVAGLLTLAAWLVHAVEGTRELRLLKPPAEAADKSREVWVQTLSGWQWVSVDLLAAGVLFLLIALSELVPDERLALTLISGYFAICGLVWIGSVLIARGPVFKLGQWLFCFLVAGLAFAAR